MIIFDLVGVVFKEVEHDSGSLGNRLHQQAHEFARNCKKKGLRILILSNCSPSSLALLKQQYPEFFSLFHDADIFIPAITGYAKPDRRVYEHILNTHNINPAECYFIDDSLVNVEAARACGIQGIVHTNWENTLKLLQEKLR